MANAYPQAVYYPFKISTEGFDPTLESVIAPIKKALGSTALLDQFVASLERLTHPEHRFKDWFEQVKVKKLPIFSSQNKKLFCFFFSHY